MTQANSDGGHGEDGSKHDSAKGDILITFPFIFVKIPLFGHRLDPNLISDMGHVMRKPVYAKCEQQRRRSACASVQSDQHLCCLLLR